MGMVGPPMPSMGPFMTTASLAPAMTMGGPSGPPLQEPPATGPQDPMIPLGMIFPPQPVADSMKNDGPVSVAYNMQPEVIHIGPVRPCPQTRQYIHRGLARIQESKFTQPRHSVDICGWVMAAVDPNDAQDDNQAERNRMHIIHNPSRLVFQCISGWTLLQWHNEDDFEQGINGDRRAPRPIAWWDLRKAFDVHLEIGDPQRDMAPYRFTLMFSTGNLYFCVELPDTVPVWHQALRNLVMDANMDRVKRVDAEVHQRKRWPAACGIARALVSGSPVGERAMAILFHCYDIDYDCNLRVGEIVMLLLEVMAGCAHAEGLAEGQDRETALMSARSRLPEDQLYDRAQVFRRSCDLRGDGKVRKDDFIRFGQGLLLEALAGVAPVAMAGAADIGGIDPYTGYQRM